MRRGTYSIVARDAGTGELGVGVQSHWFSVGSVVSWARPGVGAVATQALAEVAHGPHTLERLAAGDDARQALAEVLAPDPLAEHRQLGVVDRDGLALAHTGARAIAHASHVVGEGFACQANMMARAGVPEAMAETYRASDGDLAERLLAALMAAERAGGDLRGRQSAALLIVPADGESWRSRFEVRVEDHPDPLAELTRLLRFSRAYELASEADERLGEGAHEDAAGLYLAAAELAPEADELTFWAALGVAEADLEGGLRLLREAIAVKPSWLELLERLPPEMAPTAAALRESLASER